MKILVTGGNGEFCKHLVEQGKEHSFLTPIKSELDVRSYWGIDQYFYRYHTNFDYVIHAGAITRPMVIHEDNPRLSIHTNIIGTANVVLACERYDKKMIYISTDYVYPGIDGNYKETDSMNPFTKYGWSKLGGECAVQHYKDSLILRICMNARPFPHDKAFTDVISSHMFNDEAALVRAKNVV